MTHEEMLQAIDNNRFVQFCGIHTIEDIDGSYYTQLDLDNHHLNPYGIAHGGLLHTMADTTAGSNARRFAAHPVTLNSDFHFTDNVSSGILTARAELLRTGKRILLIKVTVTSDSGRRLAEGTFTYYNAV